MDHAQAELLYSFAVSIFAIGGMLGGFSGGIIANRFGRLVYSPYIIFNYFKFLGKKLNFITIFKCSNEAYNTLIPHVTRNNF